MLSIFEYTWAGIAAGEEWNIPTPEARMVWSVYYTEVSELTMEDIDKGCFEIKLLKRRPMDQAVKIVNPHNRYPLVAGERPTRSKSKDVRVPRWVRHSKQLM